jgi:hypothetical protein
LKRHRAHVEQQLAQMGAALQLAQPLFDGLAPTPAQRATNDAAHRRLRAHALRMGPVVHGHLDVKHGQLQVHRQPDEHAVHCVARLPGALARHLKGKGLGVEQAGLDIEQAVVALKALVVGMAGVQKTSGLGGGQGHTETPQDRASP